jgi:peptidoglycan/LPS O-acetylase OafA/YrhL
MEKNDQPRARRGPGDLEDVTSPHRFVLLDGMRGIAAIAVMLRHLTQHASHTIFENSALAVDLFFCLSGFVVAFSYLERLQTSMSIREFLLRRGVRLYPMFVAGFALGTVALWWKVTTGQTDLSKAGWLTATMLNALYIPYLSNFSVRFGGGSVPAAIFPTNDPSWSLFFELLANVLFATLAIRSKRAGALSLTVLGGLGLVIYCGLTKQSVPGWNADTFLGGFPRTIFGFFSGVLLFSVYESYRRRIAVVDARALLALLAALLYIPYVKNLSGPLWLMSAIFLVPVLVAVASTSIPEDRWTPSMCRYLGWLSYPLYCLHYPIYSLYTLSTGNSVNPVMAVAVCAPVTVAASHLVVRWFEQPIREGLTSRFRRATSRIAV